MASLVKIGSDTASPLFSFDDDSITSMTINTEVNLIMDEVTADTAEMTVIYESDDESLLELPWATPVYIYNDNVLTGKFYSKNVKQVGSSSYNIDCTSVIGLLEYETYYGKVYTGETFKTAVEDVISTNGLTTYRGASRSVRVCSKDDTDSYYGPWLISSAELIPFHAALMEATITINKSLLNEVEVGSLATETFCRDVICGSMPDQKYIDASTYAWQHAYGLYMEFTRESTDDPWPDGDVYFSYYTLTVPLGTLTEPTTYEIYCDPLNGKLTINGTDYTLPEKIPYYTSQYKRFYHNVYGGSAIINGNPNTTYDAALPHDVLFSKYKLSKISSYTLNPSTGTYAQMFVVISSGAYYIEYLDAYAILDSDGGVHPIDIVTGYQHEEAIVNAAIPSDALIPFFAETTYQEEILNSIGYAPGVDTLEIYGWMPILSKREALHQLMFSQGIILRKDANGNLLFGVPSTDYYDEISADEIYEEGSESYLEHTNLIKVTEHSYQEVSGKSSETIYTTEEASTLDFYIAEFTSAPIIGSPTTDGLYLFAWNCNAAIVGGVGSLSGVVYDHTKSILTRSVGSYVDGRELSVTDATLVTYLNSGNVMDRLAAYYGSAYTIDNSIIVGGHRTGNYYKFTSPFGDVVYGFLKKINRTISSIVKGNCQFLCNYTPPDIGISYQNFVILTGSGTWEVPESVFEKATPRIRVVLIAGGSGGESGTAGEKGQVTPSGWSETSAGSKGGDQGEKGEGGRFYEITIENPAYSYSYASGAGGAGGDTTTSTSTHNSGGTGGDSSFSDGENTYSSNMGSKNEYGIVNFFTGDVYAKTPSDGPVIGSLYYASPLSISYSSGGGGGILRIYNTSKFMATVGFPVSISSPAASYLGGSPGANAGSGSSIYASGGCGGGAAAGQAGGNGTAASYSGGTNARAGNGGKGADCTYIPPTPLEFNSTYYGYGGFGGGGGGGGGASGGVASGGSTGTPGNGGNGGKGGAGGDGCILIYY